MRQVRIKLGRTENRKPASSVLLMNTKFWCTLLVKFPCAFSVMKEASEYRRRISLAV